MDNAKLRVARLLFRSAVVALLPTTAYALAPIAGVVNDSSRARLPRMMPELAAAQAPAGGTQTYTPSRTPEGQPDLHGIWQVWNNAKYDIEPHVASPGVPAGFSVIVDPPDGMIPYKPWARAHQKENFVKSRTSDPVKSADPLAKCYLPGVPRVTYLGWPFQIIQTSRAVAFVYEWNHVRRVVPLNNSPRNKAPDLFMGLTRGRWEGNTLVVDVTNLSDYTWFDMAGNFASKTAHVVERYTPTGPDTLDDEVTIEDPRVYTKPWKMRMLIHRQKQPGLLEYECIALLEDSGFPPTWERDWDKPLPVPKE